MSQPKLLSGMILNGTVHSHRTGLLKEPPLSRFNKPYGVLSQFTAGGRWRGSGRATRGQQRVGLQAHAPRFFNKAVGDAVMPVLDAH